MAEYAFEFGVGKAPKSSSKGVDLKSDEEDIDSIIAEAAEAHKVDPDLVRAVLGIESGGDPKAISKKGATGLMQLMPDTAKAMGVKDIKNPRENIMGGTKYLAKQLKGTGGDVPLALARYNAGPGAVKKHGGIPPFPETQGYVKKVQGAYDKLKGPQKAKAPKPVKNESGDYQFDFGVPKKDDFKSGYNFDFGNYSPIVVPPKAEDPNAPKGIYKVLDAIGGFLEPQAVEEKMGEFIDPIVAKAKVPLAKYEKFKAQTGTKIQRGIENIFNPAEEKFFPAPPDTTGRLRKAGEVSMTKEGRELDVEPIKEMPEFGKKPIEEKRSDVDKIKIALDVLNQTLGGIDVAKEVAPEIKERGERPEFMGEAVGEPEFFGEAFDYLFKPGRFAANLPSPETEVTAGAQGLEDKGGSIKELGGELLGTAAEYFHNLPGPKKVRYAKGELKSGEIGRVIGKIMAETGAEMAGASAIFKVLGVGINEVMNSRLWRFFEPGKRQLVIQTAENMVKGLEAQGVPDEEILKALRKLGDKEAFKAYKQRATVKRGRKAGESTEEFLADRAKTVEKETIKRAKGAKADVEKPKPPVKAEPKQEKIGPKPPEPKTAIGKEIAGEIKKTKKPSPLAALSAKEKELASLPKPQEKLPESKKSKVDELYERSIKGFKKGEKSMTATAAELGRDINRGKYTREEVKAAQKKFFDRTEELKKEDLIKGLELKMNNQFFSEALELDKLLKGDNTGLTGKAEKFLKGEKRSDWTPEEIKALEGLVEKEKEPAKIGTKPQEEPIELITKPVRDFAKDLKAKVSEGVQKKLKKVDAYKKWEFSPGDRVKSGTTGKAYEITARSWNNKADKPEYLYKSVDGEESGTFKAEAAHKSLAKLGGPKGIVQPKPPKVSRAGANIRTLRGYVKHIGKINPLNFKGEVRDLPKGSQFLFKKDGVPIDDAVRQLVDDGWLEKDATVASFLEELRTNEAIVSRDRLARDISEKKSHELTEQEKRFKKELEQEPPVPEWSMRQKELRDEYGEISEKTIAFHKKEVQAALDRGFIDEHKDYPELKGRFTILNAEDLPEGKKITILDSSPKGRDVYEVKEKDPFSITLVDGETIELSPLDKIHVLKEDLKKPAPEKPVPKPKKVGDAQKVLGIDSILAKTERIDGVDYELYNASKLKDTRGIIRVFDAESGNTISMIEYPTYDKAETEYSKAVKIVSKKPTPTKAKAPEKDIQAISPDGKYVDWTNRKVKEVQGLKGTYYATYNKDSSFLGWKTKTEIDRIIKAKGKPILDLKQDQLGKQRPSGMKKGARAKQQGLGLDVEDAKQPGLFGGAGTKLYSGIPVHEIAELSKALGKIYDKHVGEPLWIWLSDTLPKAAGDRSRIVDAINKGIITDYKKDPNFINLRDETALNIEIARKKAKELAETIKKFPRAEQIRVSQIIKGSVTHLPERYKAAFEVMENFKQLEKDLQRLGILGPDNIFKQLTRKELAKKFNEVKELDKKILQYKKRLEPIIRKGKVIRRSSEKMFNEVKNVITETKTGKYKTDSSKWKKLNEDRVKKALIERGFHEGEADQMIKRVKESVIAIGDKEGTLKETTTTLERVVTKTITHEIERIKTFSRSYMARAKASILKDIKDANTKRNEVLNRIQTHYRMSGKHYLRRAYKAIETEDNFLARLMGYASKRPRLKKGYNVQRKDLSKLYRQQLGEIEEAPFLVYKGLSEEYHDMYLMEMFNKISENKKWAVSPKEWDNIMKVESRALQREHYKDFKPLPMSDKLGKLSGAMIDPYIWDDLNETVKMRNEIGKMYDKILNLWKIFKVPYNPATQFRNIGSNFILADFAGLSPLRVDIYARAAKDLLTKSGYWLEAEKMTALFGKEWIGGEVKEFLKEVSSMKDGSMFGNMAKLLKATANKPLEVYQGIEQFFKLALYTYSRESGATIKEAAKFAEDWIFNYQKIPPAIRWAKRWYSPFITFSYKAMPRFAETAIRKPWKIAKYAALMLLIEEGGRRMLGESKEEIEQEKKVLPSYMRKRVLPGQLSHLRLWYKDKYNQSKYLDLSFILPWGDVAEQWGQSQFGGRPFLPSHPGWIMAAEVAFNEVLFTGQELTSKDIDEGSDYWKKIGTQIWRQAAPSLAGSYSYNKFMSALKGERDWALRERSVPEAVFDVFLGIKIRSIDYNEERGRRLKYYDSKIDELRDRFSKDYEKIFIRNPTPDYDNDNRRFLKLAKKNDEQIQKIMDKMTEIQ